MVSSRASWHAASHRPYSDYSSTGSFTTTARDAAFSKFDTTTRWPTTFQPEPEGLQHFCAHVRATAFSAGSISAGYDTHGTNGGISTDGGSSGTYIIDGQASLFIDILVDIIEAGQKDGKKASQEGSVQEGQEASKEEAP